MKLIGSCYHHLAERRGIVIVTVLLLLGCGLAYLPFLRVGDSIVAMLPDGDSEVGRDFELLQKTPFARKLVIQIRSEENVPTAQLLEATAQLQGELPDALFRNMQSGPGDFGDMTLLRGIGDYLPVLLDESDREQLAERLQPRQVEKRMASNLAQLLQPQGIAMKERIQKDPLGLEELALVKLRHLNPLPGVRIEQGFFLSRDRRSTLILADTPIQMTDAAGSRQLLDAFAVANRKLPDGVSATLLSGHPYTLANTEVIKADMSRVLVVSAAGLLAVFLIFFRQWRAFSVFLLPAASMLAALVLTSFGFLELSGITVGFGAVLLGITIDFGLHVYFALRQGRGQRADLLQAVSKPILFGGLTTLAAFAVLLGSELPGQRQLAVFAMIGIVVALLLALFVLPHFVGMPKKGAEQSREYRRSLFLRHPRLRWWVLAVWFSVMVVSAIGAQELSIDGELRRLSYVPPELSRAEQQLADSWGSLRGRAMIFASAADPETALKRNEAVWQLLGKKQLQGEAVSLAPLLPPLETQRQRQQAWTALWDRKEDEAKALLIQAGTRYGFSENAFTPFFAGLQNSQRIIDEEKLRQWGLGRLLDGFLLHNGDETQILTLLPDRPELINSVDEALAAMDGVTLVSQSRFGRQLSQAIAGDFSRFISLAGLVVVGFLVLLFRRVSDVLLAVLPVLSGLLFMFGGMSWMGLEMNLFNVVASILIIGLGVDYGIFMTCHGKQERDLSSGQAILVSGLTTLVGFGALVLARHPALSSIGTTVLLGISAAVPTAILVIPALRPKRI